MYAGYQGFGAGPTISLNMGPAWQACMNEELAKAKAGQPHDTLKCTALIGGGATQASLTSQPGIPTLAWVAIGVAVVGGAGAVWWFKFRK
jgi:hypothetical protein